MSSAASRWFGSFPTAAKLLLILSAVLLPIGIGLVYVASEEIRKADVALRRSAEDQARAATRSIESLIARNALALRVVANAALASGPVGSCDRVRRSLTIAPAIGRDFELADVDGRPICTNGAIAGTGEMPLVAAGAIRLRVAPNQDGIIFRVGVIGGMATGALDRREMRAAAAGEDDGIFSLVIRDAERDLEIIQLDQAKLEGGRTAYAKLAMGNGDLTAEIGEWIRRVTVADRLLLLMPVLMWILAALVSWLLVTRLLIRPLKLLQRAVVQYEPGRPLDPARNLGPATEIRELRDAFARAFARVEESEHEMSSALDGQRRLVREVHHRVKNNLQVVASLLNIQGRSAPTVEARAAYSAISRRVSALSIVHRNHFAEMEENRGIALRALVTELAAELRAGAPDEARGLIIEMELDSVNTTQDVAVAVSFLVTEIVEYAMLHRPHDAIEVSLRRTGDLTARLAISSPVLVPDDEAPPGDEPRPGKVQFERILAGLAKQLRSPMERRLGRYCVDLPVFPAT
ncbi:MAG: sensor histidine kinase [Sphingomicrobium sp.]